MAASMKNIAGRFPKSFFNIRVPLTRGSCAYSSERQLADISDVEYPPVKTKFPPGNWSADFTPRIAWKYHDIRQELLQKSDVRERLEIIAGDFKDLQNLIKVQTWDRKPHTLQYKQCITRSKIINDLPSVYSETDIIAEKLCETLEPLVKEIIRDQHENIDVFQSGGKSPIKIQLKRAEKTWKKIFNSVLRLASHEISHLETGQYDTDVRLETCWRVAGFENVSKFGPGRQSFEYVGTINKQIRTELPLPEFVSLDDELCISEDIPTVNFEPITLSQPRIKSRPLSVAGHWIGAPCEFIPLLLEIPDGIYPVFQSTFADSPDIMDEAWVTCGLMNGFAACSAQAHNLGFNMYDDLTYPITTQCIVTDGPNVQLFTYQLNTLHMWQTRDANPYNNILWAGEKTKLYEAVEGGEVVGFNADILKDILRFFVKSTSDRGIDLRPYLSGVHEPTNRKFYINHIGDEPIEEPKIGRWQYPRNAVYF